MHTNINTDDGSRVFVFRQGSGWTNISLHSTASCPALTLDGVQTLKQSIMRFNECPQRQVSSVTVKMADGTVVAADAIDNIAFTDLPAGEASADSNASAGMKTDAEVIVDHLKKTCMQT